MTDPRKTFLLGVGCRGGTTWLRDYLQRSDEADLGSRKEYHVFDALDLEFAARYREIARTRALETQESTRRANARLWRRFLSDPESYFDYFYALLDRDPRIRLTADITPTYAGLAPERLAFIKAGFAARGVAVKVVFLMRDPVERNWSAVRRNSRGRAPQPRTPRRSAEAALLAAYDKQGHTMRTRYDLTIANLERVFAPQDIHYEFYERLFTTAAVERICGFLGIAAIPADFSRRMAASPTSTEISEQAARTVARHYRVVYEAMARKFGAQTIEALWPGMRLI